MQISVCCPKCQRPSRGLALTGYNRIRILQIVAKSSPDGITAGDLFDQVYAADPSGGPRTGIKIISILIWHANQQLRPQGYEMSVKWRGRGAPYVLRKLNAYPKRKPANNQKSRAMGWAGSTGAAREHW
jgi:hypothetical protein